MEPTIGRIVHYFSRNYGVQDPSGEIKPILVPAIITHVHTDTLVNLRTLGEESEYLTSVSFGDGEAGSWVWPPRV